MCAFLHSFLHRTNSRSAMGPTWLQTKLLLKLKPTPTILLHLTTTRLQPRRMRMKSRQSAPLSSVPLWTPSRALLR